MKRMLVRSFLVLLCSFAMVFLLFNPSEVLTTSLVGSGSSDYAKIMSSIDMNRIMEHVMFLSNLQTRATGYPGNQKAREYIYEHFVNYGLENVSYLPFPVTDAINYGSNITILSDGVVIPIHPLLPNKVATSATPGLVGNLIYVKDGSLFNFDGKTVENSVVLMDWMSQNNWVTAANLGAQAVIFVPPSVYGEETVISEYGAEYRRYDPDIPFRFPRFYVDEIGAQILLNHLGEKVKVMCEQRWTTTTGYNVIGYVRGTEHPNEYVLIGAYYDSYSVAPSLAPGAEEACGPAFLLELARLFAERPPKFSVMFVAFGGHHQRLMGSSWWWTEFIADFPARPDSVPTPFDPQNKIIGKSTRMALVLEPTSGSTTIVITPWGGTLVGGGGLPTHVSDLVITLNKEKPLGRTYDFYVRTYGSGLAEYDHTHVRPEPWKYFPHDSDVFRMVGPFLSWLYTTMDTRPTYYTPFDRIENVNFSNLKILAEGMFGHVAQLLFESNLFGPTKLNWRPLQPRETRMAMSPQGKVVQWVKEKAWYEPVPNALVYIEYGRPTPWIPSNPKDPTLWFYNSPPRGFSPVYNWNRAFTITDENGTYYFPVMNVRNYHYGIYVEGWIVNETTGEPLYAPEHGAHRLEFFGWSTQIEGLEAPERQPFRKDVGMTSIFRCSSMILTNIVSPEERTIPVSVETGAILDMKISLMDEATDMSLQSFCIFTKGDMSFVAFPPEKSVEFIVKFGIRRYPCLFIDNRSTPSKGPGYKLQAGEQRTLTYPTVNYAKQLWLLNEERLNKIGGVDPSELKGKYGTLHAQDGNIIQSIEEGIFAKRYSEAFGLSMLTWKNEYEVYLYVRSKLESMAYSVVYLAPFLVPFAFLAEQLLLGRHGLKKAPGILVSFGLILAFFWFQHPGFQIAESPIMVILGVSIMLLSFPVLAVILSRFASFIKILRMKIVGKHEERLSRGSEIMISFLYGVENMKKSKMRTSLTFLTIIIVSASLLSFTSITLAPSLGAVKYISGSPSYSGILIHRQEWGRGPMFKWGRLSEHIYDEIKARYGNYAKVTARSWMYLDTGTYWQDPVEFGFTLTRGDKNVTVTALWGVMPSESELSIILEEGSWFNEENGFTVIISSSQAQTLGIRGEDLPVNAVFEGGNVTIIGIAKDEMSVYKDIDGEPVTPLRIAFPPGASNPWNIHMEPGEILILPYDLVKQMGGQVVSVSLRSSDEGWVGKTAMELQESLPQFGVYASANNQVWMFQTGVRVTTGGFEVQLIPAMLGALVILNQILGGVYERKGIIKTFSIVGLSPKSISLVFFAECLVYAVIGGVLGYIFSLLFTNIFSQYAATEALSKNYSCSLVMTTWLGIMAIVIVPAIYPLLLVAKLATPSLARKWTPSTKPVGDRWSLSLPFIISTAREVNGAIEYLKEFMEMHKGRDVPIFRINELSSEKGKLEGNSYQGIVGHLNLEPYDLGISQRSRLFFLREAPDRYALHMVIEREHGSLETWERANRNFIDAIRKQMLMWQTLPSVKKEEYSRRSEQNH